MKRKEEIIQMAYAHFKSEHPTISEIELDNAVLDFVEGYELCQLETEKEIESLKQQLESVTNQFVQEMSCADTDSEMVDLVMWLNLNCKIYDTSDYYYYYDDGIWKPYNYKDIVHIYKQQRNKK